MLILFYEEKNEKIFLYFHEKYKKLLYKYIFGILKNHYDTEDALQTSWLKFANNINKVKEQTESKVVNYLITIAKHTAIDIYNKKNNTVSLENENTINIEEVSKYNDIYLYIELDDFKRAIRSIDKDYVDVLLLKYIYGYSIKEIAEILHITETNVGTRIYRAKSMIKEFLSEGRHMNESKKNQ